MKCAVSRKTLHGEVNARREALGLSLDRRERIRCWGLATASWRRQYHRDKKLICLACIAQIIEADIVGEGLAVTASTTPPGQESDLPRLHRADHRSRCSRRRSYRHYQTCPLRRESCFPSRTGARVSGQSCTLLQQDRLTSSLRYRKVTSRSDLVMLSSWSSLHEILATANWRPCSCPGRPTCWWPCRIVYRRCLSSLVVPLYSVC